MSTIRSATAVLTYILSLILLAVVATPVTAQDGNAEYRVYEYVIQNATAEIPTVVGQLGEAFSTSGFEVLGITPQAAPDECAFGTEVLSVYHPGIGERMLELNPRTAPFAMVNKVNVFEDEQGVHVSILNTRSVFRTVFVDDPGHVALAEETRSLLRDVITGAVEGTVTDSEYGQKRKKGHIGKTMGVMAGGPFDEKIKDEMILQMPLATAVKRLREVLGQTGPKWGITMAYELSLPDDGLVVFGVSGARMEAKSFSIVKAGSDKPRKKFECPGVANAAAYPIEIVARSDGEATVVQMVDMMYRMKMYFEDAGKWAFMKNMGMPGSLTEEIRGQLEELDRRPS